MKRIKKMLVLTTVVGLMGASGAMAYAATIQTPAEITAEVTGKSVEDIYEEHQAGSTYGEIANEAGVLDEFKELIMEQKKAILDERVETGKLTQEEADAIYNNLLENQSSCDGTGSEGAKMKNGIGFGAGNALRDGTGQGERKGSRMGQGEGMRRNR